MGMVLLTPLTLENTGCDCISVGSSSSSGNTEWCWEAKRGTLKDPPGAAVWGMVVDADRTPPVRRPARREARELGVGAVVIAGSS
jgi:hypothetical protein